MRCGGTHRAGCPFPEGQRRSAMWCHRSRAGSTAGSAAGCRLWDAASRRELSVCVVFSSCCLPTFQGVHSVPGPRMTVGISEVGEWGCPAHPLPKGSVGTSLISAAPSLCNLEGVSALAAAGSPRLPHCAMAMPHASSACEDLG